MKTIGWLLIIVLSLAIIWFIIIQPVAFSHVDDGLRKYLQSIPVSGTEEEIRVSYTFTKSIIPLKTELEDFKIQAPRGEWDGQLFYDPVLSVEYIKLDPKKMFVDSQYEVMEIGHVDFEGKVHFRTMLEMLRERNPNFNAQVIEQIEGNKIRISGILRDVQSEVVLIGDMKVNLDGEIEMTIDRIVNFLDEELTDSRKIDRIKKAIQMKWRFNIMGVDLEVDKAAVSELGVYVKANSSGKIFNLPSDDESKTDKDNKGNS